jgi:quinol monooxygenase YgiN
VEGSVILIVVKFKTKPEWSERWLDLVQEFTVATRAEPANLWFEWSRSVDDPCTFVLVEAFEDGGAEPHVNSDHFKQALQDLSQALSETPQIINTSIEGASDWSLMGELTID